LFIHSKNLNKMSTKQNVTPEATPETSLNVTPVSTPATPQEAKKEATATVVVVERFRDKLDHKTWYEAGAELEFDEARAADVIARGLAREKIVEG
jgi:hypothetical protein